MRILLRLTLTALAAITIAPAFVVSPVAAQEGPSRERTSSVVTIEGQSYYVHPVLSGDTFYSLSRLYEVSEDDVKAANPILIDGLKAGQVIKIPNRQPPPKPRNERQMNRLFDRHIVNQGETAYSISQRYGISIATLQEDNEGFDPAHIAIGQVINIRKASQDKTAPQEIAAEIESYSEALNSVADDGYERYVVKRGDTFYSLNKEKGVSEEVIKSLNPEVTRDGLKFGAIIRLPGETSDPDMSGNTGIQGNTSNIPEGDIRDKYQQSGRTPWSSIFGRGDNDTPVRGFKNFDVTRQVNVVIMLPLQGNNISATATGNFVEFYQGCLIALDELKAMGTTVKVDLFNTARSPDDVRSLLATSGELQDADIIIGPVYDECFREVADFAARKGIVAISPLAVIGDYTNAFQIAPAETSKMDKLRNDLSADNNVIVIRSAYDDQAFANDIAPLLPSSARYVTYGPDSHTEIRNLISTDRENIFVVLSSRYVAVEQILAGIASVHSDIMARGVRKPIVKVIGQSSWTGSGFDDIDKTLYFKTQVRFVTSYHFDRGDARVVDFDRKYVNAYNTLPNARYGYAYRGYDIVKLFVGTIKMYGSSFVSHLNSGNVQLLQTPYYFQQTAYGGKYENRAYAKVSYNKDFTIEVE